MDHGKVLTVAKVVWCLLVIAAVAVAMPHVDPWIGAPAGLFVILGAVPLWAGN